MRTIDELIEIQTLREGDDYARSLARAQKNDDRSSKRLGPTRASKAKPAREVEEELCGIAQGLMDEAMTKRGPKPAWFKDCTAAGPEVVARAALRFLVGVLASPNPTPLTRGRQKMGEQILIACVADKVSKEPTRSLGKLKAQARRAVSASIAQQKAGEWPVERMVNAGSLPWSVLALAGYASFKVQESKGQALVFPTKKAKELYSAIQESPEWADMVQPINRPMLSPPKPWRDASGGGYIGRKKLIRGGTKRSRAALSSSASSGDADDLLKAVNIVQAVPLRINEDALWLREFVWDNRIDLHPTTPLRDPLLVPAVPEGLDTWPDKDRIRFLVNRSSTIRMNKALPALSLEWSRDTQEADELLKWNRTGSPFYLPQSLCYRGRMYATPAFNHQRGDAVKALFEFFHGAPLGPKGLDWLKVHVANTGDFDKISKQPFEDRIAWVDDKIDILLAVADDPARFKMWTHADSPFSFYAACCDLSRALSSDDVEEYVSHLGVALDGSNSGVQHYSAMMRAPEGRFVGLSSDAGVSDLYTQVAQACAERAKADAAKALPMDLVDTSATIGAIKGRLREIKEERKEAEKEAKSMLADEATILKGRLDSICASLWVAWGISRSDVKRPVMTYGYSSEAFGFSQQIQTDLMGPLSLEVQRGTYEVHPFGLDEGVAASSYLGRIIFAEVERSLPFVSAAMRWLKSVGYLLGKAGVPVHLTTPDGFPLVFEAIDNPMVRLKSWVFNLVGPEQKPERVQIDHTVPTDKAEGNALDALKMKSGIAPNVVHTCDALHLRMTVRALARQGVTDVMTIHDSFTVHPGNVSILADTLKEQLIWLYSSYDPLRDLYDYARKVLPPTLSKDLTEPPKKGQQNLKDIFTADYAFS